MDIIGPVAGVLSFLLFLYQILLWVYFAINILSAIRPDWRPRGIMLLVADFTYQVVDPPLRAIRKVIPALDLGAIRLDLAWMVLLFATIIVRGMVSSLPAMVG